LCPEGPPYGRALIERNLERLKTNGVDTVLINANAQLPWYPSRTLPNIVTEYKRGDREFFRGHGEAMKLEGEAMEQFFDNSVKFYNNFLDWHEAGIDFLTESAAVCRQQGMSPWLSIRMNDMHGADNPEGSFMNWKGFADSENRLKHGHGGGNNDAYWQALNYERQEVRDYMMTMIRESVEDYDYEGMELDWLRNPNCCEPNASEETVAMMSAWMGEIRAMTERKAKITGRPFPLGLRLPVSLNYSLSIGLDVVGLVRSGVVDFVSFSNFWQTSWDMPYERYRQALGEEVTIFGVVEDAPNWLKAVMPDRPLDPELQNPGVRYLSASVPLIRANAAGKLATGVDGICAYNFHCTNEHKENGLVADYSGLRGIADLKRLRGQTKHYALATPGVNAPQWDVPCQLPVIIEKGYRREFTIAMAAEPAEFDLRATVQVIYERLDGKPPLGVSINGAIPTFECKPSRGYVLPVGKYSELVAEHDSLLFVFSVSEIMEGWNTFTVHYGELDMGTMAANPEHAVRVLSVEIFLIQSD